MTSFQLIEFAFPWVSAAMSRADGDPEPEITHALACVEAWLAGAVAPAPPPNASSLGSLLARADRCGWREAIYDAMSAVRHLYMAVYVADHGLGEHTPAAWVRTVDDAVLCHVAESLSDAGMSEPAWVVRPWLGIP